MGIDTKPLSSSVENWKRPHLPSDEKTAYRIKAEGYNLDRIIDRVSEISRLNRKQILDTARDAKRTEARSILCFWATDKLGVTQTELARLLKLTQSAVSHAARRGRVLVEDNSYSMKNN